MVEKTFAGHIIGEILSPEAQALKSLAQSALRRRVISLSLTGLSQRQPEPYGRHTTIAQGFQRAPPPLRLHPSLPSTSLS
jgi:hypothetical protein